MKITNKVLISVEEADIIDGVFYNDSVTKVADGCFYNLKSLIVVTLPNVTEIGSYCFSSNAALTTVELPVLAQCGSYCFSSNAALTTVELPVLAQCGSYCFIYNAALTTVELPVLAQCGSYCFIYNAALTTVELPVLAQCGSDCFSSNAALTTVELPVLAQCGSYCFSSNAALTTVELPVLAQCGSYCFSSNDVIEYLNIVKYKLSVKNVDGDCFVIESEKTSKGIKIFSGYNFVSLKDKVINKHECFVAEKDNFYAHGDTVKKAIGDLQFKIVADKLRNSPITPETEITVNHYRMVTGACDFGVRDFLTRNNIPYKVENQNTSSERTVEEKPMKAKDLLPILEKTNAYGLSKFKQLYQE